MTEDPEFRFRLLTTAEEVQDRLAAIASQLKVWADAPTKGTARRRQARRYHPFVAQLAMRPGFAAELAAVAFDESAPLPMVEEAILPLLQKYQFPAGNGLGWIAWSAILVEARIDSGEPLDELEVPDFWEVQLVYSPATLFSRRPPIVEPFVINRAPDETKREFRAREHSNVEAALRRFWDRVRPTLKHPFASDAFRVRLFSTRPRYERYTDPANPNRTSEYLVLHTDRPTALEERFLGPARVSLKGKTRIEQVRAELWPVLLELLAEIGPFSKLAGRLPDTTQLARWWAETVFDKRAVWQIAENMDEGVDEDSQLDLMLNIPKRLTEIGVTPIRE